MSRKIIFIAALFFSIVRTFSFSQDSTGDDIKIYENSVITKINFDGLKRTKESYMQSELEEFLYQNADRSTLMQAKTKLTFSGLFSDIAVSYTPTSESEVSLDISVKEKISFLPVPFAMYTTSTGFMGGLVVMDMNAFGIKDMAMVGGFFSAKQVSGMVSYAKQPKRWRPGFSTALSVGKRSSEITDMDNRTVLEYDGFSVNASLSVNERIGTYNTVSIGGSFSYLDASKDSGYDSVHLESLMSGGVSLGWNISMSELNEFFTSKTSFGARAQFLFTNDSDYSHPRKFSMFASLQKPIAFFPRLRLCASLSGLYGIGNPISFLDGREAGSVSILPGKFRTERIFGGQAGVEVAIVKAKFGVISLYAHYEAVTAQDFDDSYQFNQGFGGGGKLYLSKIAFPALSAGVSYNATTNTVQFAAAFGMSF